MAVSSLDSRVFRNLFGTQQIRDIFTDEAYVRRMIQVEAALARAQSATDVIPGNVGRDITVVADGVNIDFDRLAQETDIVGYPVLPLVRQLVEATSDPETAKYIHWGATTQDIMDDASMLQIKAGLRVVKKEIEELILILQRLSKSHQHTPMAGRTHLQHALPVTFGYKCAVYLSGLLRHAERLREIEARCLLVQFGGAAGTLASLGDDGLKVRRQLAIELDLKDPSITWHVARDNIAEVVNFLALVGGSLGKIALDVMLMSSNELGEVSEPFVPHRGASSTMPQKRNPISSEVILAASKLLREKASTCLDAMVADFERASGPWHLEWCAVPEAFVLAVGALHQTNFALSGLVVNVDNMASNLHSSKGLIVGEAVMMGLAPFIGRQNAHDVVYSACKTAIETNASLFSVLSSLSEVTTKVDPERIKDLCDPLRYMGSSAQMVDDVVRAAGLYSGQIPGTKDITNGHANGLTHRFPSSR